MYGERKRRASASTAPDCDGVLAEADALLSRSPYNSEPSLRNQANAGEILYQDIHLSHSGQQVEEGIVGHKAGDKFTIDVTFPEEYHAENLKGKAAKFDITLKKVEVMVLPELTDEFVAKFGPNTKSVADLRNEIRKNMQRELKNALTTRVKTQVIDGLVEQNQIDVPSSAVEQEIDVLRQQAAQRFGGNAQQAAQLPRELFEEQAKRRVLVGLLLAQVISSNELKADEERAKAMIEEIASAYEQPAEVVEYYSKNNELMNNIRNVVLEEQAVDAVLAKAQVTEKTATFDEIMNPQA